MKLDSRRRPVRRLLQPLHGRQPRDAGPGDGGRRAAVVGRPYEGAVASATSSTCTTTSRHRGAQGARSPGPSPASRSPATTAACSPGRPRSRWPRTPSTPRTWTTWSRRSAARRCSGTTRPTAAAPAWRSASRTWSIDLARRDPARRPRLRRRGDRLRLPALPGQPGQRQADDRQEVRRLAAHANPLPQPAGRPRDRRRRRPARPQEAHGRRRGGDGVGHRTHGRRCRPVAPA